NTIRQSLIVTIQSVNKNLNITSSSIPIVETIATRKSIKIPKALIRSDSKEDLGDRYPIEARSKYRLLPFISLPIDTSTIYTVLDNLIAYLNTIFINPNRRAKLAEEAIVVKES
ncbi:hypothetical protein N7472_010859, partial [Penicillium cf. griseofulvum]